MKIILRRWIPVLTLALLLSGSAFADGQVFSLLIGCDRFVSMPDTAPASETNTARMAEILTACVPGAAEPRRTVNGVGDAETLAALIGETFAGAGEDSVSWIYISTHGVREDGKTFLLLSDGEKEIRLDAEGLKELTDRIPGKVILVADACHSGGLIGKGTEGYRRNVFTGDKYTVMTSCGGEEDSWLWTAARSPETGAGYFMAALRAAVGSTGRYTADKNRDGRLTLTEIRQALETTLGASTVRTYPEEDDSVLFVLPEDSGDGRPERVEFDAGLPEADTAAVSFSYLLRQETGMLYRVIRRIDGKWDFDGAAVLRDSRSGTVAPGYRSRSVTLNYGREGGYALIQLIRIADGSPDLCAEHAVCVPAAEGDPGLKADLFLPEDGRIAPGEELCFAIRCALPCGLTVTVEDGAGKTVRYLMTGEGTRPQNAEPEGIFLCWDLKGRDGAPAEAGQYRIAARTEIGGKIWTCASEEFTVGPSD